MIPISRPLVGPEEERAVAEVIKSGQLTTGKWTEEFEEKFASYIGTRCCVAVGNGTEALHLALLALGVGEGDEVITSPFTFIASANAIKYVGATPVFVDVDEATYNIDPERIEEAVTERTKAILPIHLYGLPAKMPEIMRIAREHRLLVVEDAAQAHGAEIGGKKVGTFGDAAAFSFYPTKNMTTSEGGAITTNDDEIAGKAHVFREQGMSVRYHHEVVGFNYRMTNIAAAIGLVQLGKLAEFNARRIANAAFLTSGLSSVRGLITPSAPEDYRHVFHQYTVRITHEFPLGREKLIGRLQEEGIGSMIYYPIPVHKQKPYLEMGCEGSFPIAEKLATQVLSIPVHPGLTRADLEKIVGFFRKHGFC